MEQYRNLNRVMESGNHFKNGASLKSHTSKRNFLKNVLVIIMMISALPAFAQFGGTMKPEKKKKERKCEVVRFSAFHSSMDPKKTTLVESAKDCEYSITWNPGDFGYQSPFYVKIIYTDENGKIQEYLSVRNSERIKPKVGSKIETYAYTTIHVQPIVCDVCSICTK